MEITYTLFNGMGVKSDQATGKALRRLTADQLLDWLNRHNYAGSALSRYTVVGTNGARIPAPWFLEGDR